MNIERCFNSKNRDVGMTEVDSVLERENLYDIPRKKENKLAFLPEGEKNAIHYGNT